MASSNLMSSVTGTGLGGWNGLPQEVIMFLILVFPFGDLDLCFAVGFLSYAPTTK